MNMNDQYWQVINNRADRIVDETHAEDKDVFKAPYIVQSGWLYNYQLQYFEMPPIPAGYVYDWASNQIIKINDGNMTATDLALAELAEIEAQHDLENKLAIAELAEMNV